MKVFHQFEFPPSGSEDMSATLGDLIARQFATPWTDDFAERYAAGTAALLDPSADQPEAFEDPQDAWRFLAAFIARYAAVPLAGLYGMPVTEIIAWHRQAARLASAEQCRALALLKTGFETFAANSFTLVKETTSR